VHYETPTENVRGRTMRHLLVAARLVMGALLLGVPVQVVAQTSAEGLIEPSVAGDWCNQFLTHEISDPCTGEISYLKSSFFDLDAHLCQHVLVEGPDVGVECTIIDVESLAPTNLACPLEVRRLLARNPRFTWIQWTTVPCAETYDLIRGELPGPGEGDGVVTLGPVSCRADDAANSNTFNERDTDVPGPGGVFFYLARAQGPLIGQTSYGLSTSGSKRTPSAGDCSSSP
jgi:hypothetical protein